MSYDQTLIMAIIAAAIGMFLWGKWRHDMFAIGALVACVLSDLVEPQECLHPWRCAPCPCVLSTRLWTGLLLCCWERCCRLPGPCRIRVRPI